MTEFKVGDKITVNRGIFAGKAGTVTIIGPDGTRVGVTLENKFKISFHALELTKVTELTIPPCPCPSAKLQLGTSKGHQCPTLK